MAPSSNIIGVTTTREIKPAIANKNQNRIIRQTHQMAKLIPNCMLIGISRIPMTMPANSVMITAIEYLANLTTRKQMTSEVKMMAK